MSVAVLRARIKKLEAELAGAKSSSLDSLGLTPKTLNRLSMVAAGLGERPDVEWLSTLSFRDLISFPGFERKALKEIEAVLTERGLALSKESRTLAVVHSLRGPQVRCNRCGIKRVFGELEFRR